MLAQTLQKPAVNTNGATTRLVIQVIAVVAWPSVHVVIALPAAESASAHQHPLRTASASEICWHEKDDKHYCTQNQACAGKRKCTSHISKSARKLLLAPLAMFTFQTRLSG